MIYRSAHRATYRNLNENLGSLSYRIAQLTNQIASERRINTPSDDPAGAARVLGTRSTLSNIAQYSSNLAVSDLWLTNSSASLQSIKETLDEVFVKNEQGATDTYTANQRKIIGDEINLLFQSLLQYGNSKIGDSYIFSGQKVDTQPFALQVEAQKVIAGCQNSTKWTGKVANYGNPTFNNRPDLPVQSQKFLIEVVQPGGIDSRFFSTTSPLNSGQINGNNYGFRFTATNPQYNNTRIQFQPGPINTSGTGTLAAKNGLTFAGSAAPATVIYQLGSSAAGTSATWDGNTCVVTLQTGADGLKSSATAFDVASAINAATGGLPDLEATTLGTPGVDDTGFVQPGRISFNNQTSVSVNGDTITVFLERDTNGQLVATAADVEAALNQAVGSGAPPGQQRLTITTTGSPTAVVSPTATTTRLEPGQPFTLAHTTIDPKGTQNGLVWSVKNGSGFIGAKGNQFNVAYVVDIPFQNSASVEYDPAISSGDITVHLAVSASIYDRIFTQVYNDPKSEAFKDPVKAGEMATTAAIQTTANDIRNLVSQHPQLSQSVETSLADGSSGLGKANVVPRTNFGDGYDQPALFRVSQDGGKTWGPPMTYAATEYLTGEQFYNPYLGHASTTTSFPGQANDLVFTAKHMGTWGNEVRVEYKLPQTKPSPLSLEVGPNPWNICVNLAVDASGNITTTADDIKNAINSHPEASQLVLADLANYHEGGSGVVRPMACTALSVAEPFEVDGKTIITPLGHATATVSFDYTASAQKSPNITFQAIEQGPGGNDLGVRYTTSADPTFYASASVANNNYQDSTTVRYETIGGKTVMVVHLATTALPSCPDPEVDRAASDKWKELYPLYSCTTDRAVISTASSVVEAIIQKNIDEPETAVIWPSSDRWPTDGTSKVGPTDGTVWLKGGNEVDSAANHGVNLRFIPDGTAMQTGDVFEVPVGWYRGDEENIDINANSNFRTTNNITGNRLFGDNGGEGNILDTVQRLLWALNNNDSALIGKELPKVRQAIEQITSLETQVGTRQIRNQFAQSNLDQAKYNAQTLLSTVEDADFSQLITDLKNAQTVYEACLGATGLTSKVSLLNYI